MALNALHARTPSHCSGQPSTSGRAAPGQLISRFQLQRSAAQENSYVRLKPNLHCEDRKPPRRLVVAASAAAAEEWEVDEYEDEEEEEEEEEELDLETAASKKFGRYERIAQLDRSPDVFEEGAPELPKPTGYQQTLIKSFTLGGIGLHTGEYAYLRVRPAFAGEGRYFVRVPPGTNAEGFDYQEPQGRTYEQLAAPPPDDQELEALKLQIFQSYLQAQEEEGFSGGLQDYLTAVDMRDKAKALATEGPDALRTPWPFGNPEQIQARDDEEQVWYADIDAVAEGETVTQRLLDAEGDMLIGVQSLLSALEVCGVDNARIEIEGGDEVPILDGSALGWALEVQFAGLRPAPLVTDGPEGGDPVERLALRPKEPIIVRDGNAFITLVPEATMRLTVGVDHAEAAEIIGKQWKSWSMYEDLHYRFELAGARQYAESPEEVVALREMGYLLGGTEQCMFVAHGDRWWDTAMVRHVGDEPVRHAMADLIGDLSLNGMSGNSGIPVGHIVAYKPNHDLNAEFVRALREAATDEDWVPVSQIK